MNPTTEPPLSALQPPQPPQPQRPSTSCDRHPDEHFTGFCPSCLCERLALLDPNNNSAAASSSSRFKPPTSSTAVAALKAIFKPGGGGGNSNNKPGSSSSFLPELRRTKSFSASKNEGFSGVFEPQRKSCDVKVRNTLFSLFNQENPCPSKKDPDPSSSTVQAPVLESKDEGESDKNDDYIEVFDEPDISVSGDRVQEIVEEEEEQKVQEPEPEEELKTMKDHIDLDSHSKKPSGRDFKGSFWSAASVFSKKLQKWRQKQKMKKRRNGGGSATLPVEKPIGRQFRETQSEIADYGYGRRSCDTDPRFSLDAGRMSFDAARMSLDAARMSFDAARMSLDDPRYSFDEPRASWDGHLTSRTFPRMPTMLSVVEDAPVHVLRSDTEIPVEDLVNEEDSVPGGTAQTRDYYLDSSTRRRRSLDRSSSIRKTAAAVVAEIDEMKAAFDATNGNKVSPASIDYLHGPKMVNPDRDREVNSSSSLRDDCSETFDMGFRDNVSVVGNGGPKCAKKSRRWGKGWSIWGFLYRRGGNKDDDYDRFSRANGNGVERSFSESWQDTRGAGFNQRMLRSNSSVSWRNAGSFGGSVRKLDVEANGNGRRKRDEFVLERNRSARYSPNHFDNGLLRYSLTPSGRNGAWKSRSSQAHSITRSVLRLY